MTALGHLREEHRSFGEGRIALLGLLTVQAFIGYEWLVSGLAKVIRGGFPAGLGDELREKSQGAAGWYKSFLDGTIIPNSSAFGYVIMVTEIAIGAGLIAAAASWLWQWERLRPGGRMAVLATTALAAAGAIFLALNLHLANGSAHPWLIPDDGFDEGIDLDSLLMLLQVVLLVISTKLLFTLRRAARAVRPGAASEQSQGRPADAR